MTKFLLERNVQTEAAQGPWTEEKMTQESHNKCIGAENHQVDRLCDVPVM